MRQFEVSKEIPLQDFTGYINIPVTWPIFLNTSFLALSAFLCFHHRKANAIKFTDNGRNILHNPIVG